MKKKPNVFHYTATELRTKWGEISRCASKGNHIYITSHGTVTHVLLSYDEFVSLKS